MALRYLYGTVTQGSADAFATSSISTGLAGLTRQAMRIRELLVQWPVLSIASLNGSVVELALTRTVPTAIPTLASLGLIWFGSRISRFTTSGQAWGPLTERYTWAEDDENLVVEDAINLSIDSATTSGSNVALARIGFEIVNISELERLNLRLDSLAA